MHSLITSITRLWLGGGRARGDQSDLNQAVVKDIAVYEMHLNLVVKIGGPEGQEYIALTLVLVV